MSTVAIVVIGVAAVLLLIGAMTALGRIRQSAHLRRLERELTSRREEVAGQHRDQARTRHEQAEGAERKARMAGLEAKRARAEADLHTERARLHEQGLADEELMRDEERTAPRSRK